MDRKTQVRRIIAKRYPQLSAQEQGDLVDFVWKEAQREVQHVMRSLIRANS